MKRIKAVCFLCFCITVMFLSACKQESSDITPLIESPAPISLANGLKDDAPFKWITLDDNIDINGMNLFWQHDNIQFIGDDNAKLSIYVNAEMDDKGDLLFDDGQEWILLMETSLGNYPLFPRQYIQLGGVSCAVFNDYLDNDLISHVLVTVQQTASYQLYDCVFNSDKEAFKVIPIYEAKGINFITNSGAY